MQQIHGFLQGQAGHVLRLDLRQIDGAKHLEPVVGAILDPLFPLVDIGFLHPERPACKGVEAKQL
ncbi:hypothetical protein D3C86_2219840 [compost metagenome]